MANIRNKLKKQWWMLLIAFVFLYASITILDEGLHEYDYITEERRTGRIIKGPHKLSKADRTTYIVFGIGFLIGSAYFAVRLLKNDSGSK